MPLTLADATLLNSKDIYAEPSHIDIQTLRNLGPLTEMAGIFEGRRSLDINPKAAGPERQEFIERVELQPIDPQANGPQLLSAIPRPRDRTLRSRAYSYRSVTTGSTRVARRAGM